MPIYPADIQTRRAAVGGQYPESGGRVSEQTEVHYELGALPKLTEVDHAAGSVNWLKQYASMQTAGTESADDAYTFLDQAPSDALTSLLLYRTTPIGDRSAHTDTHAEARAYLESYQVAAAQSPWALYGTHIAGLGTLQLQALPGTRRPKVGSTLFMEGNGASEYVQIVGVSTTTETIVSLGDCGTYDLELHACELYRPLQHGYTGASATCVTITNPTTDVRECAVVSSRRFYGLSSLVSAASAGALTAQLDSIYSYAAPSARGEQALVDVQALTAGRQVISSGGEDFAAYGPAHTAREEVTLANRRLNYTATLAPIPSSGGKVQVHVRIQGEWYTIVEGDDGTGVGAITSVNRTTGSVSLALSYLPDPETWLLWEWPSAVHYVDAAGSVDLTGLEFTGTLPSTAEPGTATLTWESGGVAKSAPVGVDGVLGGDADWGYLDHSDGTWRADLSSAPPDSEHGLHWAWTERASVEEVFSDAPTGGVVDVTLSAAPAARSLTVEWLVLEETKRSSAESGAASGSAPMRLIIPGGGGASRSASATDKDDWDQTRSDDRTAVLYRAVDDGAGSLSGATGTITGTALSVTVQDDYTAEEYDSDSTSWAEVTRSQTYGGRLVARYQDATASTAPQTYSVPLPELQWELAPGSTRSLSPGTLRFRLAGVTYADQAGDGTIRLVSTGETVGSVDYAARTVTLTAWSGGGTITVQSAILIRGQWSSSEMAFRLAGDPVAPGSVQINAAAEDGTALSLTDPATGSIPAPHTGVIEHDIGMVAVTFDRPVWSGSVRYNAIAYTIVPLDPDVIGVDPTRLPPDARVPILKDGDLAVIFEDGTSTPTLTPDTTVDVGEGSLGFAVLKDGAGEQTEVLATLTSAGDSASITRSGRVGPLEYAVLEDARQRAVAGEVYSADLNAWSVSIDPGASLDGYELPLAVRYLALLHPDHYAPDLNAGTVYVEPDMDTTGYTLPATLRWRKQDVRVLADVTTTGLVTFQTALSHDYSSAAKLAGLLYHGDLQARVTNVFEQHTISDWADTLTGDAPTNGARYDDVAYPIGVSNIGTVRGRWRIKRRSDGQWDVISEDMGVITVWDGVSTLEARRLPSQAHPYFTLYAEGFGAIDWPTGSFLQFETYSAQGPYYLLRVVRPGDATVPVDRYRVRHRVGAD